MKSSQALMYAALRRWLSQETRNRAKSSLLRMRQHAAPLMAWWYGQFDAADLLQHLRTRLPSDFEILMVHSSMNAMYPMFKGGPSQVVKLLIELVGEHRTLAMPAFFFGGKTYAAENAYRLQPIFDEARTVSEMGLVTELFRRGKEVRRSLHPTHSVCARGPLAQELTATHHTCGSTFGTGSPFEVMNRHNTFILGIACSYYRVLTHIHTAEDLLSDAFPVPLVPRRETPLSLIARDGTHYQYLLRLKQVDERLYQRRSEMLAKMMPSEALKDWTFHGLPMFTVHAATLTDVLISQAGRGRTLYVPIRGRNPSDANERSVS